MTARYAIGREILGPAVAFFTQALVERTPGMRLYFLAREGFLLERAYEAWCARQQLVASPHAYLRVSRRSTALAAVQRIGPRELRVAAPSSLHGLLTCFDLDELRELAGPDEAIADPFAAPAITKLLASPTFQEAVARRARLARDRLAAYLAAQGYFAPGPVAVVDVGWRGTIQDHLTRAFRDRAVRGIYLGCYADDVAHKEGVLFDGRRRHDFAEQAPRHFVQLFEDATRGPEGTTLGYDLQGRALTKETGADRDSERAAAPALEALQAGILDCVRQDPLRAADAIKRALARLIFAPTRAELAALADLTHADDWLRHGHGRVLPPGGAALLLRPKAWLHAFHEARWKPGFVTQTGGAPLAWLYRNYERWKSFRGKTAS